MAIDSFELDVPDTAANAAAFGYASGENNRSAFPKVRIVTIRECGSHAKLGAQIGRPPTRCCCGGSKQTCGYRCWTCAGLLLYLGADPARAARRPAGQADHRRRRAHGRSGVVTVVADGRGGVITVDSSWSRLVSSAYHRAGSRAGCARLDDGFASGRLPPRLNRHRTGRRRT